MWSILREILLREEQIPEGSMKEGREDWMKPLGEYEKTVLVPAVARGLEFHRGEGMVISNREMVESMRSKGYRINERTIQKVINYIRVHGIVERVVANGRGYYIATDIHDVQKYTETLKGREAEIRAVRQALEGQICGSLF